MATSTSLNLRAVLKTAVARSGMDAPARLVSGLTPSAKALFVAAAANAQPHAAVFYIVPGDGDIDQAVTDVEFFLTALEGLVAESSDRAVLAFPSHEIDPYRGLSPHVGVTSARARALHAVARGKARIVVASAAALLPRVTGAERLLRASMDLKPGQEISPTDLAELLVDAGFTREDPAETVRFSCGPRLPRRLRPPRHDGHAGTERCTLASLPDPRHASRVALLASTVSDRIGCPMTCPVCGPSLPASSPRAAIRG